MAKHPVLTDREVEILQEVATGASNRQVAQRLHISANTVKVHLSNIYTKLEVDSRTEATLYAIQQGLVEGVENHTAEPLPWWRRAWAVGAAAALVVALLALGVWWFLIRPQANGSVDVEELERQRWQELAPMPTARAGLAVAAYDGLIYAIGGETEQGVIGAVERYDPATDSWETLPDKPTPVTEAQAAVIGGLIYVPGGKLRNGLATEVVEIYDPLQESWSMGSSLPTPAAGYALAAFEGDLFLIHGGAVGEDSSPLLRYDSGAETWLNIEGSVIHRSDNAAAGSGGIYVIGKEEAGSSPWQVLFFQPAQDRNGAHPWTVITEVPSPIQPHATIAFGDLLYILGTNRETSEPALLEYIPGTQTWQWLSTADSQNWEGMEAVGTGTYFYAVGGRMNGKLTSRAMGFKALYTVLLPIFE